MGITELEMLLSMPKVLGLSPGTGIGVGKEEKAIGK